MDKLYYYQKKISLIANYLIIIFIFFYMPAAFCEKNFAVKIEYCGYLSSHKHKPVNFTQKIIFYIIDSFGKIKWEEAHFVDVKNGIFNIVLGQIKPVDILLFDGNHYISHYAINKISGYRLNQKECSSPFYPLVSGLLMDKDKILLNQSIKAVFKIHDKNNYINWEKKYFVNINNGKFYKRLGVKKYLNCNFFNGSHFLEIDNVKNNSSTNLKLAQNLKNGFMIHIDGKSFLSNDINKYYPQLFDKKIILKKHKHLNSSSGSKPISIIKKNLDDNENVKINEIYRFNFAWPLLKQPWYFNNPTGIACDNKGYVYISDTENSQVQKFTQDGLFVSKWGKYGSDDYKLNNPRGIVADSKGNVYIYDYNTANKSSMIKKFSSEGSLILKWKVNSGLDCLEIDDNDNIYIFEASTAGITYPDSGTIKQFSSDGKLLNYWIYNKKKDFGSLDYWDFVDFSFFKHNDKITFYLILEFQYLQYRTTLIQLHTSDHELTKSNISFDDLGYLYHIEVDENGIIFAKTGTSISKVLPYGEIIQKDFITFDKSEADFTVDKNENIFICNPVQKFSKSGINMGEWNSSGTEKGYFNHPTEISVNYKMNYISVLDSGNNRIQHFSDNGKYIEEWPLNNYLNSHMQIDQNGNYYILNGCFIDYFSKSGDYTKIRIEYCDTMYSVNKSMQIAQIDEQTNIFILIDNHPVLYGPPAKINRYALKKDNTLEKIETIDLTYDPVDMVIDSNNCFFIAEGGSKPVIHKYDNNFELIPLWEETVLNQGKLNNISKMSIDSADNLYVVNDDTTVHKIIPDGTFIATFGQYGFGAGDFINIGDLCILDDKIFLTDTFNDRVQVYRKIPRNQGLSKAIIVAGKRFKDDYLWPDIQMCANYAYRTLKYQGFMKNEIFYLTNDRNLDIDNDGIIDVIDIPSKKRIEMIINSCKNDAETLVIYFSNHGGKRQDKMDNNVEGIFFLNPKEYITVKELKKMLDVFSGKVIFINDSCESGRFLPLLSANDRMIITSAQEDEAAIYVNEGSISFSSFFFNGIFTGLSVKETYDIAVKLISTKIEGQKNNISNQHPLIDDNGDSIYNQLDGNIAQKTYIGNAVQYDGTPPVIHNVSQFPLPIEDFRVLLYAEVTDDDGIEKVWALIRPQSPHPNTNNSTLQGIPSIDLHYYPDKKRYENYFCFNQKGIYYVSIYARDKKQNTSIPITFEISVQSNLSHKAVILTGEVDDLKKRESVLNNAGLTFYALTYQAFHKKNIKILSPYFIEGIPKSPESSSIEVLKNSITEWAGNDTMDFVLFITGTGQKNGFILNDKEVLKPSLLKEWLDDINIKGNIFHIYDFDFSGIFLPEQKRQKFYNRIYISSADKYTKAIIEHNGDISFAGFFWKRILNGSKLGNAFQFSKYSIELMHSPQNPIAIPEIHSVLDNYQIGIRFVLASDVPDISDISPPQILYGETSASIVANKVTSANSIKSVEALIIPPKKYKNINNSNRIFVQLAKDDISEQYYSSYDDFTTAGKYLISVFALDNYGNMSIPLTTTVTQQSGQDIYEKDDSLSLASVIDIKYWESSQNYVPQLHNFHHSHDEDWIMFFAEANKNYIIEAEPLNENLCSPIITINNSNGKSWQSESQNFFEKKGIYYIKIHNSIDSEDSQGTEYSLSVSSFQNQDYHDGGIQGNILDVDTNKPITNAKVLVMPDGQTALSSPYKSPHFQIYGAEIGIHTLSVTARGYTPYTNKIEIKNYPEIIYTDIFLKSIPSPEMHELNINKIGKGYVKSVPYAIDCGNYCYERFDENEPDITLTLNAIPENEWEFVEWAGVCSGKDQCIVTMDKDQLVIAKFQPKDPESTSNTSKKNKNCFIQTLY